MIAENKNITCYVSECIYNKDKKCKLKKIIIKFHKCQNFKEKP